VDLLIKVFADTLGVDPATLSDDSSPDNTVRWDSLRSMHLVAAIEDAFSTELSTAEIMRMRSIGLARSVLRKKGVLDI